MNDAWAALQRAVFGEDFSQSHGLEASVQVSWSLLPGAAASMLVAGAIIVLAVYWHERVSAGRRTKVLLASIRTLLMLLIVLMLYGWTIQRHRTDRPDVVLVLDDSASMGLVDST